MSSLESEVTNQQAAGTRQSAADPGGPGMSDLASLPLSDLLHNLHSTEDGLNAFDAAAIGDQDELNRRVVKGGATKAFLRGSRPDLRVHGLFMIFPIYVQFVSRYIRTGHSLFYIRIFGHSDGWRTFLSYSVRRR